MNLETVSHENECQKPSKLTFQADTLRGLATQSEYAIAASRDHIAFFEKLIANPPIGASLLDFEHQALLRRLNIERPLPVDALVEYFTDVAKNFLTMVLRRKNSARLLLKIHQINYREIHVLTPMNAPLTTDSASHASLRVVRSAGTGRL